MTTINEALTPSAMSRYTLANVTVTNNNGIVPLQLSLDRTTLYGVRKSDNTLMQSQNLGAAWTVIYTFPSDRPISGLVEMADGQCIVECTLTANTAAYVYRSTGWSTTPASRPAATWALTLTTAGGTLPGKWTGHKWTAGANGVVVVATYGTQTQSGGPSNNVSRGRYLYVSEDFGATFTLRYDIYINGAVDQAVGVHFHAVAYHEADDRIIASYGDGTGQGAQISGSPTTKQQLMYSDDRGLTWQFFDIPADYASFVNGNAMQFTTVGIANDGSLILQTDGAPYFLTVVKRTGYRTYGSWHLAPRVGPGGTATIGSYLNRNKPDGLFLTTFELNGTPPTGLSVNNNDRSMSILASDDGLSWYTLYTDTPRRIVSGEYWALNLMGPTPDGKVVGDYGYRNGGAWATGSLFVADLVAPA